MRAFTDFWVKVRDLDQASDILKKLRELGFSNAVIEAGEGVLERFDELRRIGEEQGIKVYRKLVLKPDGRKSLLRSLRSNRGKFEIITVLCENLETALVAARDSRVDSLI
ncbi:MAG: hypothetical protein DRN59_02895, partial [Thaumarchaeota archaeon]